MITQKTLDNENDNDNDEDAANQGIYNEEL